MASTPLFVISDAGLAIANKATPTGPYINLKSFAIGSAYGYEVKKEHTSLNGDKLYEGNISSYSYQDNNIICMVCKLPPEAGPFDFGEVALYLDDGTMFAKAAFDNPQTKYSSLGTNLALTYSFVCMLQLTQSVAVFNIQGANSDSTELLQIANWTNVVPPELSVDPNIPMVLVKELDNKGDSTLLIQSSNTRWTPASNYFTLGDFMIGNASATWVELTAEEWPFEDSIGTPYPVEACSLLLQLPDGLFRSVASIQHIGSPISKVRFLLNPEPLYALPPEGSTVRIYANEPGIGNQYLQWRAMLKLLPANTVKKLTVGISSTQLLETIEGPGQASATVTVTPDGNAPYTYKWMNASGDALLENEFTPTVTIKANVPNGGAVSGVVKCEVRDSFGIKATISISWYYQSNLV